MCVVLPFFIDGIQIQLGSGPGRPTESGWHVQFTLANVWLHLFLVPVGLHEISSEISEPGCIGSLNGRLSKLHWFHQLTKLLWYQNCFSPSVYYQACSLRLLLLSFQLLHMPAFLGSMASDPLRSSLASRVPGSEPPIPAWWGEGTHMTDRPSRCPMR